MIYHLKKFGTSLHWTKDEREAKDSFSKTSPYGVELWALQGTKCVLLAKK